MQYEIDIGEFPAVLDAITSTGGAGVFMLVPGDFPPPIEVDTAIANEFGTEFVWYPTVGNHDLDLPSYVDWIRNNFYSLPYIVNSGPLNCENTTYSFDYGVVHFVVINEYYDGNSDTGSDGNIVPELYNWLEADLGATNKKWIFVIGHEPAYPQPDADWGYLRHVGDSLDQYPTNRDAFWRLLDSYDVAAYICGHTHAYSRYLKDGVWQVNTGQAQGTGQNDTFIRVKVNDYELSFDTYRSLTGTFSITDSFKITNAPIVVRGNDNRLYYNIRSCEGLQSSWKVIPDGTTCDSPAAVVYDGKLYLVVRGMEGNSLYFGSVDLGDDSFSGWDWISGSTPSAPTLTSYDDGSGLILVVRGTDNQLYYRQYDILSDTWTDWDVRPAGTTCDRPAAVMVGSWLHLVVRGETGHGLYYESFPISTPDFLGWDQISGETPSTPTLARDNDGFCLVVRGMDDVIYHKHYSVASDDWMDWTHILGATTHLRDHGPAATISDNNLHVSVLGSDGYLYYGYLDVTGEWSGWTRLSGSTASAPTLTS